MTRTDQARLGRSVARCIFEFGRLVVKQTVKGGGHDAAATSPRIRCFKHPVLPVPSARAFINRELLPTQ
jgi:hypothetical protein